MRPKGSIRLYTGCHNQPILIHKSIFPSQLRPPGTLERRHSRAGPAGPAGVPERRGAPRHHDAQRRRPAAARAAALHDREEPSRPEVGRVVSG